MIGDINRDISFAKETEYWESNLKMIKSPWLLWVKKYLYSKPYTKYWLNMTSYYVKFNGQDLYLATLWNVLYGYRWYHAGYRLDILEHRALQATFIKTRDWKKAELDETEDWDRYLYKLWYELATDNHRKDVNKDDLVNVITKFLDKYR